MSHKPASGVSALQPIYEMAFKFMHPVLFKIPLFGGVPVYSYGVLLALGFLIGSIYIRRECERTGFDPGKAMDLVFYILIAALVGSRVLHVFVAERDRFLENPLILFKIWEGGLVFYGGLLGAIGVSLWYLRKHGLSFWGIADVFAPAIALGHAIGRQGCLLAGCCYGRPLLTEKWFTIVFPHRGGSFAPPGVPLYPTQIMESLAEFSIFLLLFSYRKRKKFEGQLFLVYLMAYSVMRYGMEFFRGDLDRGFLIEPWFSTSQFISALLLLMGLFFYWKRRQSHAI